MRRNPSSKFLRFKRWRSENWAFLHMLFLENKAQINKTNYATMLFMSKQVSLPKISARSCKNKNKNRPYMLYTPFLRESLQLWALFLKLNIAGFQTSFYTLKLWNQINTIFLSCLINIYHPCLKDTGSSKEIVLHNWMGQQRNLCIEGVTSVFEVFFQSNIRQGFSQRYLTAICPGLGLTYVSTFLFRWSAWCCASSQSLAGHQRPSKHGYDARYRLGPNTVWAGRREH